jgi:uncharacterized membrane protein
MNTKSRIIYWVSTVLLCVGMLAGGVAQLLKAKANADGIVRLGYPLYFLTILGIWKLLGVAALLIPGRPLLKEWAYAGFFFAMTGAVFSHIASGEGLAEISAPLFFAALTIISWYARPADRKIAITQ